MKYWAFLSYSHTDAKWGDWLHKALETYRVPRRLVGKESRDGKIPARLFPIFRDREELPVSADLPSNINEALRESRYLIVICSPRAAQSRWVGEEIKAFQKLGREDRILALIVDGEPNASDGKPGFISADECFPEPMRYRLGADGQFSSERTEPIAADARQGKDGKNNAKLKLLAGLLGVNYDELKQREQERRVRRARAIGFGLLVLVGIFAALAIALFFKEREARAQQTAAERARGEARAQQTAAEQARDDATRSRDEARATLSRSDFLQAVRLIDEDRDLNALAVLSRSLRFDPKNQAAACRLATLLAYREYPTLVLRLEHEADVQTASFSPNGNLILTIVGTEVRVWDARTGRPLGLPMKHTAAINSALFSPDGKRIVTASGNADVGAPGAVRVWDAETGNPLIETIKSNRVGAAQFSSDGNWILVASASFDEKTDGDAEVCDSRTGRVVTKLIKHEAVKYAEFSPDGARVVTASTGRVRVWDAHTGNRLTDVGDSTPVFGSVRFSSDGKWIVTASLYAARVWDAQTGKPQTEEMIANGRFASAQFSPDSTRIVTSACPRDGECVTKVWDAKSGKQLGRSATGDEGRFSPDGRRIVTVTNDQARLWNGSERDPPTVDSQIGIPASEPMKCPHGAVSAQFSPNGICVLIAAGKEVQVWRVKSGNALSEPIRCAGLRSAQFSPDGKHVMTVSNGNIQIWRSEDSKPRNTQIIIDDFIESAEFSADGKSILAIAGRGSAAVIRNGVLQRDAGSTPGVWDVATGNLLSTRFEKYPVVAFDFAGRRIATASGTKAEIRNWYTGSLQGVTIKQELPIDSMRFSPDGKWILTFCTHLEGQNIAEEGQLWDSATGKRRASMLGTRLAEFSPDSKVVATVSSDRDINAGERLRVREIQTGQQLSETSLIGNYSLGAIRFSPDGRRLATAGKYELRAWDSKTLKPITEIIRDFCTITFPGFSSDSRRMLASSSRVWDTDTGKPLSEPMPDDSSFYADQFSPDGTRILTKSEDQARVWDIMPASKAAPEWLSRLAEAVAGQHLNDYGTFEPLEKDQKEKLEQVADQLDRESSDDDWIIWGRWFLADRSTRTISPFSKVTVPEYIESRIKENTMASLAKAEELALGNTELLNRIAIARAALPKSP
jgi:WD40 repeat protein